MPRKAAAVVAERPRGARDGRTRAVIDAVRPILDAGRFAVKRVVGETVRVEADAFTDGHDLLGCVLRHRQVGDAAWTETRLRESHNDLWLGEFTPSAMGAWEFGIVAWVDPFLTWSHDLGRRIGAGQGVETDLKIGATIVREAASDAKDADAAALKGWAKRLEDSKTAERERADAALDEQLAELMWRASPRRYAVESVTVPVWVDRRLALFGAWYEMFPRSAASERGAHGTLDDVRRRLDEVAEMGFDVLYLPPIHPIGQTERKGRNNAPAAGPGDVGSPWAIGAVEGGHKSVHPELGTMEDFGRLVKAAAEKKIEIALDIAFQCSPDHPYVTEHPEWFRHRPDGSIQYAENPPKKYQDIYPFDFECDAWEALWAELKSVFVFWAERGVRVFRVDNPHTKPFEFWDWVIAEVRKDYPDAIFLSEAFTKPKKMQRLAKGGFTQSYTYFTWRPGAEELREYVEELAAPPVCDLMHPSFWPNTPDILTEQLATGGRNGAMARFVLAATLTPAYGIYGPVYELCDFTQRPGAEENLNSEKYEVRWWDRDDRWSLKHFIGTVNRIRRQRPALQQFRRVRFHECENPAHLAYSKRSEDGADTVLCVVNTDPKAEQWGPVRLGLASMGLMPDDAFTAHDLLTGIAYAWRGADQVVGLKPGQSHIFRIDGARPDGADGKTGLDGAAD